MTHQGEMSCDTDLDGEKENHFWQFPDFTGHAREEVTENDLVYDDERTKGVGKELITEGLFVWYGHFKVLSDKPLIVRSSGSHIQMNFSLQSSTTYFSESATKPFVRFRTQQHNLFLLPERNLVVQWKPSEQVEVFTINMSTEFFFSNLPATHPLCKHFQMGISAVLPAFMSMRNLPLTSKMISSLFEILNCSYSGYHKSLFIKAKVIELMALQFEQYEQLPLPDITSSLKEADKEKMHLARKILSENLDKTWSLKDLAHQIGTNEYNLKKYFKEVFGKPVFGYLHDLRMENSMLMLQQPGSKIGEISQKTGYKNPTHFTAAFKKYFGILPNKIRIGLFNLIHFSEYIMQFFSEYVGETSMIEVI